MRLDIYQAETARTAAAQAAIFQAARDILRSGRPLTGLGACRTWGVESENRPQRDQFLPDLQPNSRAIGQKDGKKWAAAVDLQPTIRKSDRLLVACCTPCKSAQKTP